MEVAFNMFGVWIPTLLAIALRLVGMFMLAPVFSHSVVPVKLRIPLALVMALAITARMSAPATLPASGSAMAATLAIELMIGLSVGYAARLIFTAVQLGAFHVGQQMGLSLGETFNPFAAELGGPVRSVFVMLSLAIFLLIGGHRALIGSLVSSFDILPPISGGTAQSLLTMVVGLLGASFALALKVAAPVLVAMLLATVAMGMLQKTMPQCNLLSTHLPIRTLVGLVVLAASLGVLLPLMQQAVDVLTDGIAAFAQASAVGG